jgi:hypothetical protein
MRGPDAQYRCQSCNQLAFRSQLATNAWGDPCCPACHSPALERHRTKSDTLYAWCFTFRVFCSYQELCPVDTQNRILSKYINLGNNY